MSEKIKKAIKDLESIKTYCLYCAYESGLVEEIPFAASDMETAIRIAPSLTENREGETLIDAWVTERML